MNPRTPKFVRLTQPRTPQLFRQVFILSVSHIHFTADFRQYKPDFQP